MPVSFGDNLSQCGFECKIKCNDDDNDDLFLILPAVRPPCWTTFYTRAWFYLLQITALLVWIKAQLETFLRLLRLETIYFNNQTCFAAEKTAVVREFNEISLASRCMLCGSVTWWIIHSKLADVFIILLIFVSQVKMIQWYRILEQLIFIVAMQKRIKVPGNYFPSTLFKKVSCHSKSYLKVAQRLLRWTTALSNEFSFACK